MSKSSKPYQIHLIDGTYFDFDDYEDYHDMKCQLSTGDFHTARFIEPTANKRKKSQIDTSNVISVDFIARRRVS